MVHVSPLLPNVAQPMVARRINLSVAPTAIAKAIRLQTPKPLHQANVQSQCHALAERFCAPTVSVQTQTTSAPLSCLALAPKFNVQMGRAKQTAANALNSARPPVQLHALVGCAHERLRTVEFHQILSNVLMAKL